VTRHVLGDDADAAFEKAVRILHAAAQTTAALQTRLRRAGFDSDVIEEACVRLAALGYLDDRRFAAAVAARRRSQGKGVKLVAAELRQKGVEAELIDELLHTGADGEELAAARAAVSKLLRQRRTTSADSDRWQLMAPLVRRGFDVSVARQVLSSPHLD